MSKYPSLHAGLERWLAVVHPGMFNLVCWSGDEFDLVDLVDPIDRIGLSPWTWAAQDAIFTDSTADSGGLL